MDTPRPTAVSPRIDDPIELLLACHEKVRRFTMLAERLRAHLAQAGADAQAQDAARSVLRYFDVAAPLHHADEDEDLYPALRTLARPGLDDALTAISAEHVVLNRAWSAVRPWLQACAEGQALSPPVELTLFVDTYRRHAQREEAELYPHAQALTPTQTAAICAAMVRRRSVPGSRP